MRMHYGTGRNFKALTKTVFTTVFFLALAWNAWTMLSLTVVRSRHTVDQTGVGAAVLSGEENVFDSFVYRSEPIRVETYNAGSVTPQPYMDLPSGKIQLIGKMGKYRSFLTIGIPSIRRKNGAFYLHQTIDSLISKSTAKQRSEIVVVVFLADFDKSYNNRIASELATRYQPFIGSGFLQILQVSRDCYPQLDHLKRNFGDNAKRVKWRAKQVIDYAILFTFCRNISDYYLQLEDDVVSANNYTGSIREFIQKQRTHWVILEFSIVGFVGKLFKSTDLYKLAQFMFMFYQEQPVDWLIVYFRLTMTQTDARIRKPTLFQHMGLFSSLEQKGKVKLRDQYFRSGDKNTYFHKTNPDADLYTTLVTHRRYSLQSAYDEKPSTFFWGKTPKEGDEVVVVFKQPIRLKRIFIQTGTVGHWNDILYSAKVQVSATLDPRSKRSSCHGYTDVGQFSVGRVDITRLSQMIHFDTKCLRIYITKTQDNWVIISDIAIFKL